MLGPLMRSGRRRLQPSLSCSLHLSSTSYTSSGRLIPPRQRRHSSSKPSSPSNDNSRSIPASAGPSGKDVTAGARKRSTSKTGKPKSKDTSQKLNGVKAGIALPSVPSTQHLHSQDVTLASFFSLHRPISVVAPVPPTSTTKAFSTIFEPSTRRGDGGIAFTLSSALSGTSSKSADQQVSGDLRSAVTQASTSNAEPVHGDAHSVYINVEELAKNFRPFHPPPAPEPVSDMTGNSQYQTLTSVFSDSTPGEATVTVPQGFTTHSPRATTPLFGRMRSRRINWIEKRSHLQQGIWHAISVKRQRKLKMKKHKYKKLLKRTRNVRRRMERG